MRNYKLIKLFWLAWCTLLPLAAVSWSHPSQRSAPRPLLPQHQVPVVSRARRHEIAEGGRCFYDLDCPPLYYCNQKLRYSQEHQGYGFGGYGPGGYGVVHGAERGGQSSGYAGTHTNHDYGGYKYGICKKEAVSGYEPHDK